MNKGVIIGAIVLLGVILYFAGFGNQKGVALNCETKLIEGIATIPPPLMAVYQPEICSVTISVKLISTGEQICGGSYTITTGPRGIYPCNKIKDYIGQTNVTVLFYDQNRNIIGSDSRVV